MLDFSFFYCIILAYLGVAWILRRGAPAFLFYRHFENERHLLMRKKGFLFYTKCVLNRSAHAVVFAEIAFLIFSKKVLIFCESNETQKCCRCFSGLTKNNFKLVWVIGKRVFAILRRLFVLIDFLSINTPRAGFHVFKKGCQRNPPDRSTHAGRSRCQGWGACNAHAQWDEDTMGAVNGSEPWNISTVPKSRFNDVADYAHLVGCA